MVASMEAVEEYMEELLFPVSTEKPKRFFGRNQMKSFNANSNAIPRSRRDKNDSHSRNNQRMMLRLCSEREAMLNEVEREVIQWLRTNDKKRRQTGAGKKKGKALNCRMNERKKTHAVYSDCGSTINSSHEYVFFTDGEESYHSDSRTYPQVIEEWLLDLISGIPDN